MSDKEKFTFAISLSVLDHLGRNLYRSFATVLGEAISNSWDADAENVWIVIDKDNDSFFIKDDGIGMTGDDFQDRFLKIGYSKRKDGTNTSDGKRPYIGRKGIGKLALLSCADKITVVTKTEDTEYIGGVIENSGLDQAITDDLNPDEYPLGNLSLELFGDLTDEHDHGTIIYFENLKDGIKNNLPYIKKIIALYFQFSLLDDSFSIYLNGEKVDHTALSDLANRTEFLWTINDYTDPFVEALRAQFSDEDNEDKNYDVDLNFTGFIASTEKPSHLKITGTEERAGIDLFVNGRLRERDILKHIPTSRIQENYFYGQIHYDDLDDAVDRFTSSREGIVADDEKFKSFLDIFRKEIVLKAIEDWDEWRINHKKDGDPEGKKLTPKQRKSRELYNLVSEEYELPKESEHRKKVNGWVDDLAEDAQFNFGSYAECFISENLIRKYIEEEEVALSPEAKKEAVEMRKRADDSKNKANISIDIRRNDADINYLSMDGLANLVDKPEDKYKEAGLGRDAIEYKPMRDAVAHTALLTDNAKDRLTGVYENIKARFYALLSRDEQ